MRLKIISDGTTNGTYVCHEDTGERLAGVQLLTWSASSEDTMSEATIHLWGVPCEITANTGMMVADTILDQGSFPSMPPEFKAVDVMGDEFPIVDITTLIKRQENDKELND